MIRAIASLFLLTVLLAMMPVSGPGAHAPHEGTRIGIETAADPSLRRADLVERSADPADGPDAPGGAPAVAKRGPLALPGSQQFSQVLPNRRPGPMRARAPPMGDVGD
jgi:hypothetical protein